MPPDRKLRDAERSRAAILAAAGELFAERGFDGVSLGEIGAAAGLSRGSPGYLFGSKDALYAEVLRAAFAARQEATFAAFAPVRAWCTDRDGTTDGLRKALAGAAGGYLRFLLANPSFVALMMRAELERGGRLDGAGTGSTAISDAFGDVRRAGARRGLRRFTVGEAVLLFVSLTFGPVSYRRTVLRAQDVTLDSDADVRRHARLVAELVMRHLARERVRGSRVAAAEPTPPSAPRGGGRGGRPGR